MTDITQLVERVVREQLTKKLGLITLEVKELKEENREIKKKYSLIIKRVSALEEAMREKPGSTDYGV